MKQLPQEYAKRMKLLLDDEYPLYEQSIEQPPVKGFRVNTEKISLEDFEKINAFGKEKIPYTENGFYLDYEKIGNHPYHHAGIIYVQEPAAMAPTECVEINPDWKILDMCAAPGGKTTQLKNKLGNSGVLVSNEIIPSRCKILTGNIERLGLKNVITTCMDTKRLADIFYGKFDLVMTDAPCSGEGMFRKEEIAISEWSGENVLNCAKRQAEILENAAKCLKNGGYIIYATCTFSLEENEITVDEFLQKHPEFELVRVNEEVENATSAGISFEGCKCENINFARRFYPHKGRGEGQFMAVLHNKNMGDEAKAIPSKAKKPDKCVFDFLDDVLLEYNPVAVKLYNSTPVYFEPDFEVTGATVFSYGITIGELKKNYIQPHHQLFMALGGLFKRKIELLPDSEELKKYLHGEEIPADCENGWAVVTVNGCAVGGAKVVSGIAKNHYPKGLRTKC